MDSGVIMTLLRIVGGHQIHGFVIQNTISQASVVYFVLEFASCHAAELLFSFVP
jgi:hypothetical protein